MKRLSLIISILLLMLLGLTQPVTAGIIDHLQQLKQTVVTVRAYHDLSAKQGQYGAGIIIHPKGYVITNLHTILGATHIFIRYQNQWLPAQLITVKARYDLALLKILMHPAPFPYQPLGDSNRLKLGERIYNIGHAFVWKETLSQGRITALGQKKNSAMIEMIQIQLNLYKGDSGGPLINDQGELIGIVTAQLNQSPQQILAIPANKIKKLYINHLK